MLKVPHGRTIKSMAEDLEVSERTIYRYKDLLEENGFPIDKEIGGERWFIVAGDRGDNMLNFDIDEANLIKDLLENNAFNHTLKDGILQKLYINSELHPLANNVVEARINGIINKLKRAVKKESKIILKNYHSVNGNAIRDYFVEPHSFSPNYQTIYAFHINEGVNKQFRVCRIGDIQELDKPQTHKNLHESFKLDPFGYNGDEHLEIILKLNHASVTRLRESYPQAYHFLTKVEEHYIFHGIIHHLDGAARFILSQMDNIQIIKGEELIEYILTKTKAFNDQFEPRSWQ
ncbi:MAG: WYL domain-containing protein [Cyclobacteriaceae bacterium]|nr:WYL domain-containing protein [Cyclobacteriaceae bacterium]